MPNESIDFSYILALIKITLKSQHIIKIMIIEYMILPGEGKTSDPYDYLAIFPSRGFKLKQNPKNKDNPN